MPQQEVIFADGNEIDSLLVETSLNISRLVEGNKFDAKVVAASGRFQSMISDHYTLFTVKKAGSPATLYRPV